VAFCLRIAPSIGEPDTARLSGIQPRHALEQQLAVLSRETRTEISKKWDDLRLRCSGQKYAGRERSWQAAR